MDLTFSEFDNNDDGYPNESYANMNSDRYWEAPTRPQENGTLTLKKNNVVRLFGPDIQNQNNINISFEDPDLGHNSDTRSIRSDSSNSLIDMDVIGKN